MPRIIAPFLLPALLSGCLAPPQSVPPLAPTIDVALDPPVHAGSFKLQAYTESSIHHVRLTLSKLGAGGSYAPVPGAVTRIPGADLAQPITVRKLRLATSYRVLADAFVSADEAQPVISVPQESVTDFATPSVTTDANGRPTASDSVSLGALRLTLNNPIYYHGTKSIAFDVAPRTRMPASTKRVTVTLKRLDGGSWTTVASQYVKPDTLDTGLPLNNLRHSTTYRISMTTHRAAGDLSCDPDAYYFEFSTPSPVNGVLDPNLGTSTWTVPTFVEI